MCRRHIIIIHLRDEEIIGTSYEKEFPKANQKELRVENVINRKGDKLHVKAKRL